MGIQISPTTWRAEFICDVCKKPIVVAGHGIDGAGIVVWQSDDHAPDNFLVVHKSQCDPKYAEGDRSFDCWVSLGEFLMELQDSLKVQDELDGSTVEQVTR
jgi:hypothetical protein